MFIGAIIGSRFWAVFLFDWGFYSQHPEEIIKIWHGGLSIQGGIVGALIVGIWYVKKHHIFFWELADLCAPGLLLGQSIGRDANLMNGAAFGDKPLYPAEVWEGQMDVIIFAILIILMQKRLKRGYLFLIGNILYNVGRFLLEMLRGDSPRFLFGWTTAQWTAVSIILLCVIAGLYLFMKESKELRQEK